ncbi:MAG: D-alanine--D-alanine ligase [Alistipes sp.]|nr:D-alanine--D-alanine ligase [Alistipes sp.]
MKRLHIALLAGGNSSERGIALQSAAQIAAALDHEKYDVKVVDLHYRNWTYTAPDGKNYEVDKNDFSIEVDGVKRPFDYALVIIHGTPGENGMLQGYLEMMGIPHSSCSTTSSVITFDKISTKRAVRDCGVNLAREVFLRRGDSVDVDAIVEELGLPMFVKPNASGSSFGVSKVSRREDLERAVELAFTESDEVLIEEAIVGREMACGVLVTKKQTLLFPVTEIVSKKEFFDYEAKYEAGMSDEITPADISDEVLKELNRMTLAAYKACRCSGVVRVDFIVTESGKPYMIELNSIPGMSGGSIVPKQAREIGLSLGELFDMVIEDTMK